LRAKHADTPDTAVDEAWIFAAIFENAVGLGIAFI
jgi:hypothetical protein